MSAYRRVDDLWSPAGWLPVHRDQLRAHARCRVWEAFTFFTQCLKFGLRLVYHHCGIAQQSILYALSNKCPSASPQSRLKGPYLRRMTGGNNPYDGGGCNYCIISFLCFQVFYCFITIPYLPFVANKRVHWRLATHGHLMLQGRQSSDDIKRTMSPPHWLIMFWPFSGGLCSQDQLESYPHIGLASAINQYPTIMHVTRQHHSVLSSLNIVIDNQPL